MARQGKLHSSPFHVETMQYKYAIEHENDGYVIPGRKVECNHKTGKQVCRLWNSGFDMCTAHKCHFHQLSMRKTGALCNSCAFFWKKCMHPKHSTREKEEVTAAEYCCYLLRETDNESKYHTVKRNVIRVDLTTLLNRKKHLIKSWTKYIVDAEREMKQYGPTEETYIYLANKIASRKESIAQAKRLIVRLQADLEDLGGELQSLPKVRRRKVVI